MLLTRNWVREEPKRAMITIGIDIDGCDSRLIQRPDDRKQTSQVLPGSGGTSHLQNSSGLIFRSMDRLYIIEDVNFKSKIPEKYGS